MASNQNWLAVYGSLLEIINFQLKENVTCTRFCLSWWWSVTNFTSKWESAEYTLLVSCYCTSTWSIPPWQIDGQGGSKRRRRKRWRNIHTPEKNWLIAAPESKQMSTPSAFSLQIIQRIDDTSHRLKKLKTVEQSIPFGVTHLRMRNQYSVAEPNCLRKNCY